MLEAIQLVHNHSRLKEYDLFLTKSNSFLKYSFILDNTKISIPNPTQYLIDNNHLFILARIDYNKYDSDHKRFHHCDFQKPFKVEFDQNQLILFFDNLNFNYNYVLYFENEYSNVIFDPRPGKLLDSHFDASSLTDFGIKKLDNEFFQWCLWSPPATKVEVLIYSSEGKLIYTLPLLPDARGVWKGYFSKKFLDNENYFFYQYKIWAYGKVSIGLDPYSPSMGAFNPHDEDLIGKSAYVDFDSNIAKPTNFRKNYSNRVLCQSLSDVIAYELHIRDLSISIPSCLSSTAGTYLGCIELIPHIKKLGVTHVQLMPVMNFYTVNESDRSLTDQNALKLNYNWGYDPHHYFSPEGWYSTDPHNPYRRVYELRKLIQSFHDSGLGVILDVVFNHTYCVEVFENIAPGCYYRFDSEFFISGASGAGPVLETRHQMVRKLIISSLIHWIENYHVDGFRFDLLNLMDQQTLQLIYEFVAIKYDPEKPSNLIFFGEGWNFSDLPLKDSKCDTSDCAITKYSYPPILSLSLFNDTTKNAIVGKPNDQGYVIGNIAKRDLFATACCGALRNLSIDVAFDKSVFEDIYHRFAFDTSNVLHYISIHDGLTLWDNLCAQMGYSNKEQLLDFAKRSFLMLFTLPGRIIIQSGDELLRSKPLSKNDPEPNRTYTVQSLEEIFFVHENSYASSDFTNMIRWEQLFDNNHELFSYAQRLYKYLQKLIHFRRNIKLFTLLANQLELVFIDAYYHDGKYHQPVFRSFFDKHLDRLEINFRCGPPNSKMYVVGEVHSASLNDNPPNNSFVVNFDSNGFGSINFTREQILNFSLDRWGNPNMLDFKLVYEPASWSTIDYAYSLFGKNTIDARMIKKDKSILIDLSKQDFSINVSSNNLCPWIAYILRTKHKDNGNQQITEILIVHNPSDVEANIDLNLSDCDASWCVVADNDDVNINSICSKRVLFPDNQIIVLPRSSAILRKTK